MSRFVLINAYTNYVDAHIARGVLEEEGISCWLKDENTLTIDPILTNALGGIKLMVEEADQSRAIDILEKIRRESKASIACPKCRSHNTEVINTPRKASNWIGAFLGFFTTSVGLPMESVNHCFNCGNEFKQEEEKKGEE